MQTLFDGKEVWGDKITTAEFDLTDASLNRVTVRSGRDHYI